MKESDRYVKIVEWSEADQAHVGSAPGLILGGCHGLDELCQIVDETIEIYKNDNRQLAPATAGRDLARRLDHVA